MIRGGANNLLYGNNIEAQEIWRVTQPEVDAQDAEILRVFDNTRVTKSDENGIEIWELTYDLMPDLRNDPIEDRRDAVLTEMRTQLPFTERWLKEKILPSLFAGDFFRASVDWERLLLYVDVPVKDSRQLLEFNARMRRYLPADVHLLSTRIVGPHDMAPTPIIAVAKTMHVVKHTATPVEMEGDFFLEVYGVGIVPGALEIDGCVYDGFAEIEGV